MAKANTGAGSQYYLRDDGVVMVKVGPGQFVSELAAARLQLLSPGALKEIEQLKNSSSRTTRKKG